LNIFGYLAGKALRSTDDAGGTGNYGILDQRAALVWVQGNIAAFGGDPKRVLLAGESSGGASVANHLVRPKSWGLFQRAAIESGAYFQVTGEKTDFEPEFQAVLQKTNCSDGNDDAAVVKCLQALPADALLAIQSLAQPNPTQDGVDLSQPVGALYRQGRIAPDVPVLLGSTREDLRFLFAPMPCGPNFGGPVSLCTEADFHAFVTAAKMNVTLLGNHRYQNIDVDTMVALYQDQVALPGGKGSNLTKWNWAAWHFDSDASMICPTRRTARWTKAQAYTFTFDHAPEGPSGSFPNLAHHASEIPFVFHVLTADGPSAGIQHIYGADEIALSAVMARYWIHFAATGQPSGAAMAAQQPDWPAYTNETEFTMVFGEGEEGTGAASSARAQARVNSARCDYWDIIQDEE
jgi:para-nitrobenzyl esterase